MGKRDSVDRFVGLDKTAGFLAYLKKTSVSRSANKRQLTNKILRYEHSPDMPILCFNKPVLFSIAVRSHSRIRTRKWTRTRIWSDSRRVMTLFIWAHPIMTLHPRSSHSLTSPDKPWQALTNPAPSALLKHRRAEGNIRRKCGHGESEWATALDRISPHRLPITNAILDFDFKSFLVLEFSDLISEGWPSWWFRRGCQHVCFVPHIDRPSHNTPKACSEASRRDHRWPSGGGHLQSWRGQNQCQGSLYCWEQHSPIREPSWRRGGLLRTQGYTIATSYERSQSCCCGCKSRFDFFLSFLPRTAVVPPQCLLLAPNDVSSCDHQWKIDILRPTDRSGDRWRNWSTSPGN